MKELAFCPDESMAELSWEIESHPGVPVGKVKVDRFRLESDDGLRIGVRACFKSALVSSSTKSAVALAAERLGVERFNWYQIALEDTAPTVDWIGNVTHVPYIDPPAYGYGPSTSGGSDIQWGDRRPWYYDETLPPEDENAETGYCYGYDPRWAYIGGVTNPHIGVHFADEPILARGVSIRFHTWLVGVYADGSLGRWLGGFEWHSVNDQKGRRIKKLKPWPKPPTQKEYADLIARNPYVWEYADIPIQNFYKPNE